MERVLAFASCITENASRPLISIEDVISAFCRLPVDFRAGDESAISLLQRAGYLHTMVVPSVVRDREHPVAGGKARRRLPGPGAGCHLHPVKARARSAFRVGVPTSETRHRMPRGRRPGDSPVHGCSRSKHSMPAQFRPHGPTQAVLTSDASARLDTASDARSAAGPRRDPLPSRFEGQRGDGRRLDRGRRKWQWQGQARTPRVDLVGVMTVERDA